MVIVMHCVYAVTDANLVLLADNVFSICNIFLYVCFIFCHFGLIYNEKGCHVASNNEDLGMLLAKQAKFVEPDIATATNVSEIEK